MTMDHQQWEDSQAMSAAYDNAAERLRHRIAELEAQ